MKKTILAVIHTFLFVLLACEGLNLRGEGTISIDVQPAGCTLEVYVDDSLYSAVTIDSFLDKAFIEGLPAGKDVELNISMDKYLTWDTTFEVQGKDTTLISKIFTGYLNVITDPSGAIVVIDNEPTNSITPNFFEVLIGKDHSLHLEHNSAASLTKAFDIYFAETTYVNEKLNTDFANIIINSEPTGAEICLDGVATPYITNNILQKVAAGEHNLTLKKSGFRDWDTTVTVVKDVNIFINATLEEEDRTGDLQVNSIPSGAVIWLDYVNEEVETNYLFKDLLVGTHHVRLAKDGYKDWETTINVKYGEKVTVDALLEEGETPKGNLQVNSTPTGAEIWINGTKTDQKTNYLFEDMSVRSYQVKLTKEGYLDWETTVVTVENQTVTIDAILEPEVEGKGDLEVNSEPDEAEIWLDGNKTNYTTDHRFSDLDSRAYELKLVKFGYKKWDSTVVVLADEVTTIDVVLEEAVGNLDVKSDPKGAWIWLNGDNTGDTTDHFYEDLSVGLYTVELTKDGFYPWDTLVSLIADSTVTINKTLESIDTMGYLLVKSTPTGATIWIDSVNTGDTTDHLFEDVAEGQHTVELKKSGFADWDTVVTVCAGETTTVDVVLDTVYGYLHLTSSPDGAAVYIDDAPTGDTTPCYIEVDDADTQLVHLELSGYGGIYKAASVNQGDTVDLDFTLLHQQKFDDFESYANNSYPSSGGWYHGLPAYGYDALVVNSMSHSLSKSFRLRGNNNARVDCFNFSFSSYDDVYHGLWIYVSDNPAGLENGSCGPAKMMVNHIHAWESVRFADDGYIYFGWSEGDPNELHQIEAYQTNKWYRVDVKIDYQASTAELWINGVHKKTMIPKSHSAPTYALWTSHMSGTFYDDVQICGD